MKEISTSIYTFSKLIESGCLYVDKTAYLYDMVSAAYGQFFLSRPRRFGKSLTVSALEAIFRGRRDLFEHLYISETGYAFEAYPVIHLDFARMATGSQPSLEASLAQELKKTATEYGVTLESQPASMMFGNLIDHLAAHAGKGVVILIDEYDKPLIDHLHNGTAESMRAFMDDFYQVIKGAEPQLRFVFITGVTKFSKISIFSKLNNLNDISMDPRYAALCGYTQQELETCFADYMDSDDFRSISGPDGQTVQREEALQLLKYWYDGFCFCDGCDTVYNPVSVGQFFVKGCRFSNYWFATGTPSFLTDMIRKNHIVLADVNEAVMTDSSLNSFDIVRLSGGHVPQDLIVQLLYQSGYLTIDKLLLSFPQQIWALRFPNHEVELSFTENLVQAYFEDLSSHQYVLGIITAARTGNSARMIELLKNFFANLPYDIHIKDEKYYQSMAYAIFRLCGMDITAEERTNIGRIDAVLNAGRHLYIIEFKLNKTAAAAVQQIENRQYTERYVEMARSENKVLHKLGINFDYSEGVRNITDWADDTVND